MRTDRDSGKTSRYLILFGVDNSHFSTVFRVLQVLSELDAGYHPTP